MEAASPSIHKGDSSAALRVELLLVLLDLLGLQIALDQELVGREDIRLDLRPFLRVVAMPGLLQLRGDGSGVHWPVAGADQAALAGGVAVLDLTR